MKRALYIILLSCFAIPSIAQSKKFGIGLEYALGFSDVTNFSFGAPDLKGMQTGSNAFIKGSYAIRKNMDLTLGIGYLVTKEYDLSFFTFDPDIDLIETLRSHHYIVIPVGYKLHFGSFFINPEFGLAFENGHSISQNEYRVDGNSNSISGSISGLGPANGFNDITLPIFLSIGNELDLNKVNIMFGIKGYYSLNRLQEIPFGPAKYFGAGFMTGLKF